MSEPRAVEVVQGEQPNVVDDGRGKLVWVEPPVVLVDATHALFRRGAPHRVTINGMFCGSVKQTAAGEWLTVVEGNVFGPFPLKVEAVAFLVRLVRHALGIPAPAVEKPRRPVRARNRISREGRLVGPDGEPV